MDGGSVKKACRTVRDKTGARWLLQDRFLGWGWEKNYLGRKCACPDSGIIAPPPPAGPDKTGRRSTLFVSLDQNQVPHGPRRSLGKKTRGRRHFQGSSPCIKSLLPVMSNLDRKMQCWVQVLSCLADIASPSSSSTRLLSLRVRVPGSNQSWTWASAETLLPDGRQRLAAFRPVHQTDLAASAPPLLEKSPLMQTTPSLILSSFPSVKTPGQWVMGV